MRGYVYCLYDVKENICRIGKTSNSSFGRQNNQAGYYHRKLLVTTVLVNDYSETEKSLHKIFADKKLKGDWFKISGFEFITAIQLIAKCYFIYHPTVFETVSEFKKYGYDKLQVERLIKSGTHGRSVNKRIMEQGCKLTHSDVKVRTKIIFK